MTPTRASDAEKVGTRDPAAVAFGVHREQGEPAGRERGRAEDLERVV
jgi:hypothetical protein